MTAEQKHRSATKCDEANAELAAHYRRELLRIGITTQCRFTYNRVAAIFNAKNADDLLEIAKREGAL